MTIHSRPPAPAGNMNTWAERLNDWIMRNRSKLAYYLAGQSAAEEGHPSAQYNLGLMYDK